VLTLLLLAATISAIAVPSALAAGPSIAFLNPSSFADAGERGIIVSNQKPDAGPACCDAADDTYRLAAWVANPPANYNVFFAVTQGALEFEITNTRQVVDGTWQAQWSMPPSLLDAPAVLHAYIVVGDEAVASVDQPVTIQRVQENIDLGYPVADGTFGTYAGLATAAPATGPATRKKPIGVVDALFTNTPQLGYIRAFYTTSAPGTAPKWAACGTEANNGNIDNGVRCTLKAAADQLAVTAVAAVTNDSPSDFDARFNQSGDAVAISTSYAQTPTDFSMDNGQQLVAKDPRSGMFFCSGSVVTTLIDQVGRQVAAANIDIHAEGPSDSLKFDNWALIPSAQPPDRGDHKEEDAVDCTSSDPDAGTPPSSGSADLQGEHQRFGQPDRKHIESLGGGTNDLGKYSFQLYAEETGATLFTAWVDERDDGCGANDDLFTEGELNASGSIGWAAQAPEPVTEPLEEFVPCGSGGTPSPGPTDPPPPDGKHGRSVSMFAARGSSSNQLRLYGRVSSGFADCKTAQRVKIQMRSPNDKRYRVVGRATSDAKGKYSFERRSPGVRTYRAVLSASAACKKARSKTVRAG
jgi:hypothetical protein